MNKIDRFFSEIELLLMDLGFQKKAVPHPYGDELNYVFKNLHCIPHCIDSLGFLIEYAHSYEDAILNDYGDGDSFSIDLDDDTILNGIKEDILREINSEYPNKNFTQSVQ